jgi:hypothetical protein
MSHRCGGHYSSSSQYQIPIPPPFYYQRPQPSSDVWRSLNAAVVGARVIHFHCCNEGDDLSTINASFVAVDTWATPLLPPHIVD